MRTSNKQTQCKALVIAAKTIAISAMLVLSGCSHTFTAAEKVEVIPYKTVKPEIDYSSDAPDCQTAAQRIEDNLAVGMTLKDVRRLVGPPRLIMPGIWWWTSGFSNDPATSKKPLVRYPFGPADDDVAITSFSSDSAGC